MITNLAAYKFVHLADLPAWQQRLRAACEANGLKGTILLGTEGINLMLAGSAEGAQQFQQILQNLPEFRDMEFKLSYSETVPFRRLLVKIKREIISFRVSSVDPIQEVAPYIEAKKLKEWLDAGKPVTLLDTRNVCEIAAGTFENAIDLGIEKFGDFPEAIKKLPAQLKQQPVVTFCTGGIRCEKAAVYLQQQGFEQVYQLHGGILQYFIECGGEHYLGKCFVFDERVAIDANAMHKN